MPVQAQHGSACMHVGDGQRRCEGPRLPLWARPPPLAAPGTHRIPHPGAGLAGTCGVQVNV